MANRFKFRAWNKLRNEMIDEDGMQFGTGVDKETLHPCVAFWGEFIMFNLEDNQSNCLPDEDQIVLMQCTGLKDDNDALIYEGDIVLFLDRDWINAGKDTIKTKVIFEKGCFWLETFNKDRYGETDYISIYRSCGRGDKFEVIGNIYENPELIK